MTRTFSFLFVDNNNYVDLFLHKSNSVICKIRNPDEMIGMSGGFETPRHYTTFLCTVIMSSSIHMMNHKTAKYIL